MITLPTRRIRVEEQSQIGEARRAVADQARTVGLDEAAAGRCAIIASEISTNLVKHSHGGDLCIDAFDDAGGRGLEILGIDRGPGLNVAKCLRDGYSTAGTIGNGLGAISRTADVFDIYSEPGKGTVVLARVRVAAHSIQNTDARAEIGALRLPYPGEPECGDDWAFSATSGETVFVADGLGHGREAAKASRAAVDTFLGYSQLSCIEVMHRVHAALAPTRGAAVALARIDRRRGAVEFVGIGNISGALLTDGKLRRMVSHNGTAGHMAPRIAAFSYPYGEGTAVVLHSDGLSARWDLDAYPGLSSCHPGVIAGVLLRDHGRGRDDMCVVVLRVTQ